MRGEADRLHPASVQEAATNADPGPGDTPLDEPRATAAELLQLSLEEAEETSGELHLRLAMSLRLLGEQRADRAGPGERSPRWHVAALVAATELAAHTLGALAAGASEVRSPRLDRHAATIGAVMYAAPTIPALVTLLGHDRRRLASLARTLEGRLDEVCETPWGRTTPREILVDVFVQQPARCALLLERLAAQPEA